MSFRSLLLVTASLCGLALNVTGCAIGSVGPMTDQKDPTLDLTRAKTYKWLDQDGALALRLQNPDLDFITKAVRIEKSPILEERIRPAFESALQKRGLRPATNTAPDLYLTFYKESVSGDWYTSWRGLSPGVNGVPLIIFPDFDRTAAYAAEDQTGVYYLVAYDAAAKRAAWSARIRGSDESGGPGSPEFAQAIEEIVDRFMG